MKIKKRLAFLLGLTLSVQMGTVSAFAEEFTESELNVLTETVEEETTAPPVSEEETPVPHLYASPPEMLLSSAVQVQEEVSLPSSIDFRKQGLVTAVKDQGGLGTCWAHASIANIESTKIKENPHIDLSERYLAQFVCSEEYGKYDPEMEEGAFAGDAAGLLTNWIGPVSESVAPYWEEYDIYGKTRKEIQQEAELHVIGTNYIIFEQGPLDSEEKILARDLRIQKAKQIISEGHTLYIALNFDKENFMNLDTNAYYYPSGSEMECNFNCGHAMLIVGYDDDYSVDNFKYPPQHNGAFLVKNSWGTDDLYGDNGYCWISYDELSISDMVYFETEDSQLHDTLYAHDDFGCNGFFALSEEGDETVYVSNVFTAEENGFITDAMFCCNGEGDQYEITVYTNLKDESVPTSGEAHGITSGTVTHLGYQTIPLHEAVPVKEGETFAIVAKISGEKSYHISCEYSDNIYGTSSEFSGFTESTEDAIRIVSADKILATFGKNQSFFSADGENWTDMYDSYDYDNEVLTGNLCLKALAVKEGAVHFSSYSDALPLHSEITLSDADGREIYYSTDGENYAVYTEPILFTGEMSISAYVEGQEETVYTQHYDVKKAEISSLLVINGNNEYYADISKEHEFEIILPVSAENAVLLPITTGTLTDGETVYQSYEEIPVSCGFEPTAYHFTAQEDGLIPMEYIIHLSREYQLQFSSGVWGSYSEDNSDLLTAWYSFNADGSTGLYTNRIDGTKTEFSYVIEDGRITLAMGGSVKTGYISSDWSSAKILWDDGSAEHLEFMNDSTDYVLFLTNAELLQMANAYYTALTGTEPETSHAELENNYAVVMTVSSENGGELVFTVDTVTAIGTLQNGHVVNLQVLPEKEEELAIKPGIWQGVTEYGMLTFYYFAEDGTTANIIYTGDGTIIPAQYQLEQNQICFQFGSFEQQEQQSRALLSLQGDSGSITWSYGTIEQLKWLSDETPETFSFTTDIEFSNLALEYCLAQTCSYIPFEYVYSKSDGTVIISPYHYTPDQEGQEGAVYYSVDRVTGIGTDQDGNAVDLFHPVEVPSEGMQEGIWCIYQSDLDGNDTISGVYWFSPDKTTGIFKDAYTGAETAFTYRFVNGSGIAVMDESTYYFSKYEFDGNTFLNWMTLEAESSEVYQKEERIAYIENQPADKSKFTYYSENELIRMAMKDLQDTTGIRAELLRTSNVEGETEIVLVVPNDPDARYYYTIDPLTGEGYNPDGELVNLPQTGNNTPDAVAKTSGAGVSVLTGIWLMLKSGMCRKKTKLLDFLHK